VVDRLAAALEIQAADLLVRPPSARARKAPVLDGER
jgi:hypothetical protein